MREILFRGKVRGLDEWLYGDLYQIDHAIYIDGYKWRLRVEPETVGQFTGLLDKNGNKIFEGDIVNIVNNYSEATKKTNSIGIVKYREDSFVITWDVEGDEHYSHFTSYNTPVVTFEVVGNIHDNKELV